MLWIMIALMTGAAVLCVVWPLSKPRRDAALSQGADLRFYQEQLHALDRDVETGLVAVPEAVGSRIEIGRRLIAAADRQAASPSGLGRGQRFAAAALVIVLVPLVSIGLYLRVGAPDFADMPLASRETDPGHDDIATALARVESHLAAHPDDGRGWDLLAPLYLRFGRYEDAVHAFERALALQGETAARRTGYGQALMLRAGGVVTAEARAAFEKALAEDPREPQPQFFLGLAAEQDGNAGKARALWTKLIDDAPADAPWRSMVQAKLTALDGGAAAPPAEPAEGPASPQGAVIASLPADQQRDAIHGMVDGLAARLSQNGQDREGWLKLVRAYSVLGERAKALGALSAARRNLAADAPALVQLDGLAHELGLEG